MQSKKILPRFQDLKFKQGSSFALLIDPDKVELEAIPTLASDAQEAGVDFLFFGGSLVLQSHMDQCIERFKSLCNIPVLLFPGSPAQVIPSADALLYLSLISGRNPELLIGQHVVSAAMVKRSGLEIISTGYMIVDGGKPTTVSYMSHSQPIPRDKADIALCTAWAGEMQGKHLIYIDAGSGAQYPASEEMVSLLDQNLSIPLIVGGGIRTAEQAFRTAHAGAQVVVVGNALEKDRSALKDFVAATHSVTVV